MKPLTPSLAVAAVSLALAGFSAHAQNTAPPTASQSATPGTAKDPSTSPTTAPESSLVQEDENFLENAIQGSHAEIIGSQLALEKTEDSDVRAFAQAMIDDHGAMVKEAEALARSKGMTPPTGPSLMQSTEITALKALSGGAFDAMYVNRIGVASHEATVEMFEEASAQAQDPEVRAMAEKTLPKLREHLEMARTLDRKQDQQ